MSQTLPRRVEYVPGQQESVARRLDPCLAATVIDPFAYVVVLNLVVEYLPMPLLTHIKDHLEHSQAAVLRK